MLLGYYSHTILMSLFRNNQISPINAASLSQDLPKIIHFNIEMRSNADTEEYTGTVSSI